jgi:hypothetical protein
MARNTAYKIEDCNISQGNSAKLSNQNKKISIFLYTSLETLLPGRANEREIRNKNHAA